MGEVIRFVSKSERERIRMILEANALYDSIFPPVDLASEKDKVPANPEVGDAHTKGRDGVVL